jgi:hypothetical protein
MFDFAREGNAEMLLAAVNASLSVPLPRIGSITETNVSRQIKLHPCLMDSDDTGAPVEVQQRGTHRSRL